MAKRAVRWAEAVDVEQTTRQWAAPAPASPPAVRPTTAQQHRRALSVAANPPKALRYRAARDRSAAAAACRAGVPAVRLRCRRATEPSPRRWSEHRPPAHPRARSLGVAYAKGELGLAQDERRAAQLYKAAAAQGDAAAQHNLGLMYMSGGKAPKALKWFRAAAAQGHAPYLYNLATARVRHGVPRDADEASSLYRRAAMLASADAAYALGRLEPTRRRAVLWSPRGGARPAAARAFCGCATASRIRGAALAPAFNPDLSSGARATEDAPRGPSRLLERRHGLAAIVECGACRPCKGFRVTFPVSVSLALSPSLRRATGIMLRNSDRLLQAI